MKKIPCGGFFVEDDAVEIINGQPKLKAMAQCFLMDTTGEMISGDPVELYNLMSDGNISKINLWIDGLTGTGEACQPIIRYGGSNAFTAYYVTKVSSTLTLNEKVFTYADGEWSAT